MSQSCETIRDMLLRTTKSSREQFRKKYENTAAIAVSSVWVVEITDSDKTNHTPFNRLRVFNNSSNDIEIRFGKSTTDVEILKDGDILDFTKDDLLEFEHLEIYNRSAINPIAIGEIIIIIRTVV